MINCNCADCNNKCYEYHNRSAPLSHNTYYEWINKQDKCLQRKLEKYEEIVGIMDSVIMNPPPDCRPIKSTSRKKVYETLYEIQRVIGKHRFLGENEVESEASE